MKLWIAALTGLTLMAFAAPSSLSIGDAMPLADQQMQDVSGKTVTLNDLKTKNGLLVMFSCNTCPYVVKNQERTRSVLNYAKAKGIGVAVLNSNEKNRQGEDSYSAMQEYGNKQQYKWVYAVDKNNALADAFGATRTPEVYLFDNSGKLVYHGAIDDSPADAGAVQRQHLKVAIDEMSKGSEVSVKTSRSVGCSIKRITAP